MALSENGLYSVVYRGCKEMPKESGRDLNATNAAIQEVLNAATRRNADVSITASGVSASDDGSRIIDSSISNVLLSGSRDKHL